MIGTFECIVSDVVLAESKTNKTPSVKFKLTAVKNAVTGETTQAIPLYFDAWLTDAVVERTLKALSQCFGWNGSDLGEVNGTGIFNGYRVWAVCEEEEYENRMVTKVKFMNPMGGGSSAKPLDAGSQKTLAESLRGRILKHRQDNENSTAPVGSKPTPNDAQNGPSLQGGSPSPEDDSDLPF